MNFMQNRIKNKKNEFHLALEVFSRQQDCGLKFHRVYDSTWNGAGKNGSSCLFLVNSVRFDIQLTLNG